MSTFTIKEMKDFVDSQVPSFSTVQLGDLEFLPVTTAVASTVPGTRIMGGGPAVVDKNTGENFYLGKDGLKSFCTYIGVPANFLVKLTAKMQSDVVTYILDKSRDNLGVFSHISNDLQSVYKPSAVILPPQKVAEMIGRVFKDTDLIGHFDYNEGLVVNVHTPDVFIDAIGGDRTNGGIRFKAYHGKTPQVSAYMERLICTNGTVAQGDFDNISVKGYSLDEIINNMEAAAQLLLNKTVPAYLENWKKLTTIRSTNPEQLIHRLSREVELSTKLESRIIEAASSLTGDSYYDVINLITSFQHIDGVDGEQFDKIQKLGGNAIRDLGGHRCNNCQHNLEA